MIIASSKDPLQEAPKNEETVTEHVLLPSTDKRGMNTKKKPNEDVMTSGPINNRVPQ